MTDQRREQISALVDGELEPAAVDNLVRHESTKNTWRSYHLISDVMHKRFPLFPDATFTDTISQSINDEPTVLAPAPRPAGRYLKPVAGLAVAASVATIAILGFQQFQTVSPVAEPAAVLASSGQARFPAREFGPPVQSALNAETAVAVQPVAQPMVQPVQAEIQSSAQISRYILNHNVYQSNIGVQGVTPYVRLVTTDNNE